MTDTFPEYQQSSEPTPELSSSTSPSSPLLSHKHSIPKHHKIKAIVAGCGASLEIEIESKMDGNALKQRIAEETSIIMNNQLLFTQNATKITDLHLTMDDIHYELFTKDNHLNMDACLYIFDKHHAKHPEIPPEYMLDPKEYEIKVLFYLTHNM